MPAPKTAEIAIGSIGCGYDIGMDLRLRYCKGNDSKDSCLIELDEDGGHEIDIPGGISIPNVSKAIKCNKGELTRITSDVLSFQEMSEQFNQGLSLSGTIPSGLFNCMFEFSGCWHKDAATTKALAFDGVFITLYSVELEKSKMELRDHVKKAVPSTWEPAALARFIETYGTHIIVGVKVGGKDVIYIKQEYYSTLQPADIQKRLKDMADKRFLDASEHYSIVSEHVFQSVERLRSAGNNPSSSYAQKEDIISIYKRRGGSDNRNLSHHEWVETVTLEPDLISMTFIPITSLLNGVPGTEFLSHAINLYLRYKPAIEELEQFLEFQLPREWAPVFKEFPRGPQHKKQSNSFLQFNLLGPKLYVNTIPVDVGMRPVTGLRFILEGNRSNRLAVCMEHLSSLPKCFQLVNEPNDALPDQESYDKRYFDKVGWNNLSVVCTAPVESDEDCSIVTGAQLLLEKYGSKSVLLLRLRFSTVLGTALVKMPEWDGQFLYAPKSGALSSLFSTSFTSHPPQLPHTRPSVHPPPLPHTISSVYPGGPPMPSYTPELLKFVNTAEIKRGPQDLPGYWVVSGAKLVVEKGKIGLRVKYSLLTAILPDEILEGH
ncbi:hypothetical protein V6N13_115355 [Hibiscus sabdariffa]|uniref:MACPF domain-containing protein n=1 Tax=Hibiscus sabdariffa TaxID=183260 RepID=A0ABR2CRI8_9ROSI